MKTREATIKQSMTPESAKAQQKYNILLEDTVFPSAINKWVAISIW